jgi:TonB family protein
MTRNRNLSLAIPALLACLAVIPRASSGQRSEEPQSTTAVDDHALGEALCSIVYPVDRVPSPRGYHYLFYGNAFFINKDGYLLTAAHVLGQLHGGQPFLLLRNPAPQFVQATVVAVDRDHDVALLLATSKPSSGAASFLPLAHESPMPGRMVLAAALRPFNPRDSYTLEPALEERSPGEVLGFQFSQLEKAHADTELYLFNHVIEPGQSGAPVISLDSHAVVGLVEGQWLRDSAITLAAPKSATAPGNTAPAVTGELVPVPGAVIPIHYAIALLQQKNVAWASPSAERGEGASEVTAPPAPFSLVPAPYPSQSLFGGEVVLDALVSRTGIPSDVKVVDGDQPFLEKAVDAVQTWTFLPGRAQGHVVEARIAIVFQFPQPYVPPRASTIHTYNQNSTAAVPDSAALPLTTVEPKYPAASTAEGSVILYESVDPQGHVHSIQIVRALEPLTAATVAAANQWQFAPAKRSGAAIDSAAVVVVTFRRPLVTGGASHNTRPVKHPAATPTRQ